MKLEINSTTSMVLANYDDFNPLLMMAIQLEKMHIHDPLRLYALISPFTLTNTTVVCTSTSYIPETIMLKFVLFIVNSFAANDLHVSSAS